MPDVLICGDTQRSPEIRHEVPLMVPDQFLYAETGGARHVVVSSLERARISAVDATLVVHAYEEFGIDEILAAGADRFEALLAVMVRACRELGIEAAAVPGGFPLELADRLRADGDASRAPWSWPASAARSNRRRRGCGRPPRCCARRSPLREASSCTASA